MSTELHCTSWQADAERIRPIRVAVFVHEQGVPYNEDFDGSDEPCIHLLAWRGGRAVATGRIAPDGRIGRMAVLQAHRRQGIGASLVCKLVAIALEQGLPGPYLHAQCAAEPFYAALGFQATGEVFMDAGIAHVRMNYVGVQA